ncbi:MAG: ComEC/Rec2 family competence protein [Muribaculaceae bacterium]|nr:ComEC/Rec2 family competence protein [Muribaculaceae bacterium]
MASRCFICKRKKRGKFGRNSLKMNAPMLLPFISLATGILLTVFGCGLWVGASMIILGSVIYFGINSFKKIPAKSFKYSHLHYLWITFWFVGIGIIDENLSIPQCPAKNELEKEIVAEGRIYEIKNSTSGDRLTIDVFSTYNRYGEKRKWRNFRLLAYSDAVSASAGNIVVFPLSGLKPIVDSENSFHKGYAEGMKKRGIFYSISLPGNRLIKTGNEPDFLTLSSSMRDKFVSFIEKQPLQKETRNFIITLLAGDRNYLDENTRSLFADAGISHVLALSGMHIGVIAGILLFLLFPLNFLGKYKIRFLLTAIILWFYAFLTGMSPSIVRACVMSTAFIVAIMLERKNSALNSLALAGFIILLFSPNAFFEVGFQLSFICVASLILFADKLNPIDRRTHPKLYYLFALILASLITTFTSWIIVAYYFQSFPTMFLPSNLLIIPFLPFYVVLVLLCLVSGMIGFNFTFLYQFTDRIYEVLKSIITFFAYKSSLPIEVPAMAVILWLFGVAILAFFLYRNQIKKGVVISSSLFIGSLLIVYILPTNKLEKGILICNTYPKVEIKMSDSFEEKIIEIPVNAISLHRLNGMNICVMDYKDLPESLEIPKERIDFLIVTGRFKGTMKEVYERLHPNKVVTHSSLRKERENELLIEAEELTLPSHSLRKDKALKIYFN